MDTSRPPAEKTYHVRNEAQIGFGSTIVITIKGFGNEVLNGNSRPMVPLLITASKPVGVLCIKFQREKEREEI
jgi:hypothetical protein